jgi:hypothetical protein
MASAVLTVDDLLFAIFESFDAWDGAAACVCRAWRQMWADTDDGRRGGQKNVHRPWPLAP